ncbi:LysE family translocator [Aeromonas hydrophila]|nr:LysE family translocator [Aeromonas hydrophila]
MQAYLMFIAMAGLTILSPGPSTLKSLTNALNHGLGPALVGMAGLTCGVLGVATLSATSLGVLLATSPTAFEWVRYGGVLYLAWLGVKLWRSPLPGWVRTRHRPATGCSGRVSCYNSRTPMR